MKKTTTPFQYDTYLQMFYKQVFLNQLQVKTDLTAKAIIGYNKLKLDEAGQMISL